MTPCSRTTKIFSQLGHEQLQAHVNKLESQIHRLENQSLRNNLIFGLLLDGTDTWEDCEFKAGDILNMTIR